MAHEEHVNRLKNEGVKVWNEWVKANPPAAPDLRGANLKGLDLCGAKLKGADLRGANLKLALLKQADLRGADLRGAHLDNAYARRANLAGANLTGASASGANLRRANLSQATLAGAYLRRIDLSFANLSGADVSGSNLEYARLVDTKVEGANLSQCFVYGVSAWNLLGTPASESNLVITPYGYGAQGGATQPRITVDDLEIAQFIHLLLNHRKIRDVISTVGERAVLLLGRFTPERKGVLDAVADRLREMKYLPMMFDFERIPGRDFTETVKVLAGISKFVIADITQPKSVPQEAEAIIPDFKIPFLRIIQSGEQPWAMASDLDLYEWVLPLVEYPDEGALLSNFDKLVRLAESKYRELLEKKARHTLESISIESLGG